MNATTYQREAERTLVDRPGFTIPDDQLMLLWTTIGLTGEAGEVAEHVKKGVLHRHGVSREVLANELGDVCWYLAAICSIVGLDLGDVMQSNVDKLRARYPNGFTSADSIRRADIQGEHK